MLFFKGLQALVQFLAGHRQKRLLQRQCHMRIGQRLLDAPQLAADSHRLIDFIRFFHSNEFTVLATRFPCRTTITL